MANALEIAGTMGRFAVCAHAPVYKPNEHKLYRDPANYSGQHIIAHTDNIVFNLIVTAVAIAIFRLLRVIRLPRWFCTQCEYCLFSRVERLSGSHGHF